MFICGMVLEHGLTESGPVAVDLTTTVVHVHSLKSIYYGP